MPRRACCSVRRCGGRAGSIFWERLWPALATLATAVGLFLALSWLGLWLWLPPIGRAVGAVRVRASSPSRRWCRSSCCACPAPPTACAGSTAAAACRIARRPPWPTTSRHRTTTRCRSRCGMRMSSARSRRARRSRPACRRRASPRAIPMRCARWSLVLVVATFFAAGGERWQRIAAAFDWQGVVAAGEFPRRRLGDAADLYRQAADHPARHAPRRDGARSGRADCRCRPAARWWCARPASSISTSPRAAALDRPSPDAVKAPRGTEEHRFTITDAGAATLRGIGDDLTWSFDAIPDKPPTIALAKDPERAGARLAAAQLQARGRLRRHRSAGDVRAQGRPAATRRRAASALRAARFRAGAAAAAHQERHRPDHQGSDRASVGRRRRHDDAGRPRRRRQRGHAARRSTSACRSASSPSRWRRR